MAERFARISVPVIANEAAAPGHFVTTFGDAEMARSAQPGQFYQVRLTGRGAPFLPRPFSIYDWHTGEDGQIDGFKLLYKVVGKGTTALSRLVAGDTVAVTGPLGNTFTMPEAGKRVLIVAGGIGIAPFLAFAKRCIESNVEPERIELLYGSKTADLLVGDAEFASLGVAARFATDDATRGMKGTALDLLVERLKTSDCGKVKVYASGPTPMLDALTLHCRKRGIWAQVSLEARMVCGVAVCNSCAIRVISHEDEEGWDYKLVCRDGPVFNAEELYVD